MSCSSLVSPQWLETALENPDVIVLDATFHMPDVKRDPRAEFEAERIPGARFFDVDAIRDPDTPLPHMVPPPAVFAEAVSRLGIFNTTHVVCYDTYGLFSAARPWWMFRLYGHDKVSVLDGGLPGWKDAGLPVESGVPDDGAPGDFRSGWRPELVRTVDQVKANLESRAEVVVDARPGDRFDGSTPEPRPEVKSGHIPGALNVPFTALVDPGTKRVLNLRALESLFRGAGVTIGRDRVVTSCGSGVTACSLALGLHLLGDEGAAVYDGSWSEWGARDDTPIVNPSA